MNAYFSQVFQKLNHKISELYNDNDKFRVFLNKVIYYIDSNEDIKDMGKDIKLFVAMLRDYSEGNYKELSKDSIYLMVGALIYLLSPIDILPDFLLAGYLDDFLIIWYVMKKISKEIKTYKEWKEKEGLNLLENID